MNIINNKREKAVYIETKGDFSLYIKQPAYKIIGCLKPNYIKNKITGENCGQKVLLLEYKYDKDENIIENPKKDEDDIYEIVLVRGDINE